jgi:intein-encoded DNA endonuclease-like protein
MTKDLEDKEKFIQLRAKGLSFDKIAKQIKISKPTLLKWSEEFKKEINKQINCEVENIFEQYRLLKLHKIETLTILLRNGLDELQKRNLNSLRTKDLLPTISSLQSILKNELEEIRS